MFFTCLSGIGQPRRWTESGWSAASDVYMGQGYCKRNVRISETAFLIIGRKNSSANEIDVFHMLVSEEDKGHTSDTINVNTTQS